MATPLIAAAPLFLAVALALSLAPQLDAASASDMVGVWSVDGDATWDSLKKSPQISKQLAGLAPDMIEQIKTTMLTQVAATTYQFTTDKLISISNGLRREERYTITATAGNVLTADCTDDQGKKSQSKVTITPDRLVLLNTDSPEEVVVLKRVR
jgi:hypothetical protein